MDDIDAINATFKGGPLDGESVSIRTEADIEGATITVAVRNLWHRYDLVPTAMGASQFRYAGEATS
jgi:hypothetical protein